MTRATTAATMAAAARFLGRCTFATARCGKGGKLLGNLFRTAVRALGSLPVG